MLLLSLFPPPIEASRFPAFLFRVVPIYCQERAGSAEGCSNEEQGVWLVGVPFPGWMASADRQSPVAPPRCYDDSFLRVYF